MSEPSAYQKAILMALNNTGKHIYAGTVSATEKARRVRRNKAAKAARKAAR